jgi:LysR family transcriptional activator of nhaA
LDTFLGERLLRRNARTKMLTETGQVVLHYADEIFSLGQELVTTQP